MGPISNIGPKTSWAARDRPELNLEVISRRNAAGDVTGRRLHGGGLRHHVACDARPHACRNSRGLSAPRRRTIAPHHPNAVCQSWRTSGRPPRNILRVAAGHGRQACSNREASALPEAGHRARPSDGPILSCYCETFYLFTN
ncbi:hypothetical protein F511_13439 [Dorcoceras hygrometricum]|uniref:Uncharacterized protein n=1 Tax=Dorcoceras hygrometricum TaxID=472368 RepID=A0A2Z7AMK8_9LAMI|nr:hypothetical protein F511_13439 [Dorcoceras hygrometricum]